jgi:SAM-dependent methyltransferase
VNDKLISLEGDEYPIVNGKPVLMKRVSRLNVTPPPKEITSQNIPTFSPLVDDADRALLILHLGSGNVPSADPRVISLDPLPCENVDIVADSEELPFKDGIFDYVESGAVFEHIPDPWAAIHQVKRVLKPGGVFRIDTAFLQSYHGFPGHYYNLTPLAVETALVGDFGLELAHVPDSATPLMTMVSTIERFFDFVSPQRRAELMARPFGQALAEMKADMTRKNPLLENFDEYALRSLAASFVVIARKPNSYEQKLANANAQSASDREEWQALKKEYYSSRMMVMMRHHEVLMFRRYAHDLGRDNPALGDPQPLDHILSECLAKDMFDLQELRRSIGCLESHENQLRILRDRWIDLYLASNSKLQPSTTAPLWKKVLKRIAKLNKK